MLEQRPPPGRREPSEQHSACVSRAQGRAARWHQCFPGTPPWLKRGSSPALSKAFRLKNSTAFDGAKIIVRVYRQATSTKMNPKPGFQGNPVVRPLLVQH